jgi:hypothetical protein
LLTTNKYKDAVLKAVNLGEDTDTTGAVTGGLAGLLYGEENIPEKWVNEIARRSDIIELADRLKEKHASANRIILNKINVEEPNQKSSWRELEPKNQVDLVEHCVSSSLQALNWDILAASVRGKKHAHFGEWRDDSYAFSNSGSWTILAVADGAGSASLSRIGSRIATSVIVSHLAEGLRFIGELPDVSADEFSFPKEEEVKQCLKNAFIAARQALIEEAEKRQCPANNLATTLLAVAHTRLRQQDLIFWINVGDCILAVFPDNKECRVLCDEDHGSAEGETCFLTSNGIIETLEARTRFIVLPSPVRALVLMTDGIADDLYPLKERLPDLLDGETVGKGYMTLNESQPLKGILHYISEDTPDERALLSWLKYDKYGSSYDDRTIVLALNRKD